ncbi:UNVERIFIED_CONTAM: hypothetical protein FKN15_014226 [Acipenser sinensis]
MRCLPSSIPTLATFVFMFHIELKKAGHSIMEEKTPYLDTAIPIINRKTEAPNILIAVALVLFTFRWPSEIRESFAAFVAAAGSLLNAALVVKFIPAHTKKRAETDSATDKNPEVGAGAVFSLSEITRLMRCPGAGELFTIKIISGLPSVVFQVMFSVIAMNFFHLKAEQTGYLLSYFGLVQMVIQGGVIGRLTGKYSERTLLLLSIGTASIVGLAQALMTNVQEFCVVVIPMMFSLCMFNVITDTILTKSVPSSDTGTMLGLCSSVQALLRTVGPTIGGFLYQNYGVLSFGYIQCAVNLLLFLYLLKNNFRKTEEHQS